MAKEISTQITIQAAPAKVWQILTDFPQYPQWNPFIREISGNKQIGQNIQVKLQPPGGSAMTFKPKILAFDANKEFRWLGHFLFKGIFDGEHSFTLKDNGDGTTTFIQSEKFNGILVPFLKKMLDNNTVQGFRQMNQQLKERAEK